jgi:anhydro-N-acetylmuramic acid kinase
VCGGGVFNADLVERIRARLPACSVLSTASVGVDPMAVEAAAFAWLAARRIDGLPGNLPGVTGARGGRVLGSITDPLGRLGE